MIDEMAIRQQIEFDEKKFYGHYDMGDNIVSEESIIAKKRLYF